MFDAEYKHFRGLSTTLTCGGLVGPRLIAPFLTAIFPRRLFSQRVFARVHAGDVVEASEPAWQRDLFVKEASYAHHPSVRRPGPATTTATTALKLTPMPPTKCHLRATAAAADDDDDDVDDDDVCQVMARLEAVLTLDSCDDLAAAAAAGRLPSSTVVAYGADDTFTRAGSLELFAALTEHGGGGGGGGGGGSGSGGGARGGGGGAPAGGGRVALLALPGGHLPHLGAPARFAAAVADHAAGKAPQGAR